MGHVQTDAESLWQNLVPGCCIWDIIIFLFKSAV